MKMNHAVTRKALALLAITLLCGCSSFNRDWHKAAAQPTPANSIEGRWEGSWTSASNAHTGNLRCLLSHKEGASYEARFRATYGKVFHFSYATPLTVQEHGDGWEFNGESNLGKMAGGVYYYEGRASPVNFFSTYKSKYDHGVFEMHRPK